MANRFSNPFPQFSNSASVLYANGTLNFYESGTSTPLAVYSDENLSVSLGTSVTLNSAGRAPTDVFLQDQDYKVILKDASSNTIWTADPVKARDSQLIIKTTTGSGSPNGSVAGTAGSSGVLPDFYWDYTNSILYVCTTTGTSSTAAWTALNASSPTAAVPPPQGRLTLTSGTPVISSSVAASTVLYYTPYVGNLLPIYNGASLIPTEFSELSLSLVASHVASTIYDAFVFSNSGVLTLVTGPAWNVSTAGSGARGTGASSTELTRIKGLYVNAVSMTGRNGSTTYSIGANLATYVGSIFMDGTNGQLSAHVAWGSSRKYGVWNAYNRVPVLLKAGDSTASWVYTTATFRPSRNQTTNSISVFSGLAEETYDLAFITEGSNDNASVMLTTGIGYNSTTAASGKTAQVAPSQNATIWTLPRAEYFAPAALGVQTVTSLEKSVASGNTTWYGTEAQMVLSAKYRA